MSSALETPRHLLRIHIISPKGTVSSQIRTALITIGFDKISMGNSFTDSLENLKDDPAELIFFDVENTTTRDIPAKQFVDLVKEQSENVSLIAFFTEVSGDRLFRLLQAGAQGFLLGPFTSGSVEGVFLLLKSGFDLNIEICHCKTPQEAFSTLIVEQLDYVAQAAANSADFDTPEVREKILSPLSQTVKTARLLCDSDIQELYDQTYIKMYDLADKADRDYNATRLRKTREKLREQRRRGGSKKNSS
jgi:hypothetical protein